MTTRLTHRSLPACLLGSLCCLFLISSGWGQETTDPPVRANALQASRIPTHRDTPQGAQMPRIIEGPGSVRLTGSLTQEEMSQAGEAAAPFADRSVPVLQARRLSLPTPIWRSARHPGRPAREEGAGCCTGCGMPQCGGLGTCPAGPAARHWPAPGEYVCDGDDNGRRVTVDGDFNLYGVDAEDTFGHFDTLDGQRLVSPSNKVCIYSPRFSAVRRVSDFSRSDYTQGPTQAEQRIPLQQADGKDFASSSKQYVQPDRLIGRRRASGLVDQTRGVTTESLTVLQGVRAGLQPYEDLSIIRFGRYSSAEGPRLNLGMQSANVWRDDLGLQAYAANVSPVIVNDVYRIEQIEQIETEDDNAVLRVVKVASRLSGRPGDVIEFTIRYDNLSGRRIGNVTIVDNLTGRLEYIPDSAESSLKANFIVEQNDVGSEMLRWEIIDPVPAGEGGVIRFQCRVR